MTRRRRQGGPARGRGASSPPRGRRAAEGADGGRVACPEEAVGQVARMGDVTYLDSAAPGLPGWVPLEGAGVRQLVEGTAVRARLIPPPPGAPRQAAPTALLLDVLGDVDDPDEEVRRILEERGVEREFPPAAQAQADALPDEVDGDAACGEPGRADMRRVPFVTIDGADAKDFDDAVAAEDAAGGGWRLYVGIADVADYVREGSALDQAAAARGTSTYLPGLCVPMLPEKLSNGLCSLRPGVDRQAMVAVMDVGSDGAVGSCRFTDAVIRSRARLTYAQAQAALDDRQAEAGQAWGRRADLRRLSRIGRALNTRRRAQGALDLDLPEPEVLFGEDGGFDVRARERQASHRLIEELMLAANMAVGRAFQQAEHPCIWRVHPQPDPEKVGALSRVGQAHGFSLVTRKGKLTPLDLAAFLAATEGHPAGSALHFMALRTLTRAEYSVDDGGHFGLGVDGYLHFTSPIRRYPDLIVHRLLKRLVAGRGPGAGLEDRLGDMAAESSKLERRSMEAGFEALDLYRALAMRGREGEEFEAKVTAVTSFGVFVQVAQPFVEGLLHVSDLGDDWYEHDEEGMFLVAKRSGQRIGLGDALRVRVSEVNVRRRRIAFTRAADRA